MALIQTNVDDDIKLRADKVFARNGLTTPMACKIMVTQVANDGRSPFDGIFTYGDNYRKLPEELRRDMVYAEAQELGLIADDSSSDPIEIPADLLADWGIEPSEVGQ